MENYQVIYGWVGRKMMYQVWKGSKYLRAFRTHEGVSAYLKHVD